MSEASNSPLMKTPLHAMHTRLGARMAEFGGYDMPIQYADGIMAEHNWTRTEAGLFDVSHMGPSFLSLPQLGGGRRSAPQGVGAGREAGALRHCRAGAGQGAADGAAE